MKFSRKSAVSDPTESAEPVDATPAVGPFDVDDVEGDGVERIDLGSLLIALEADRELRLQVDETTGGVQAVMLAGPDGALELRAFAAPRHGDLWSNVRPQIAEDMVRRGGVTSEREGRFGTELMCELIVSRSDGSTAKQPSRVIGINGPRWLLRATLIGRPAMDVEGSTAWEDSITRVVVRRGHGAMPVGEPLPVVLPDNAKRVDPSP